MHLVARHGVGSVAACLCRRFHHLNAGVLAHGNLLHMREHGINSGTGRQDLLAIDLDIEGSPQGCPSVWSPSNATETYTPRVSFYVSQCREVRGAANLLIESSQPEPSTLHLI